MKILIVYHAGAMRNPRQIYEALAQTGNLEVTIVVAQRLKVERVYDPSGWLIVEKEEGCNGYRLVPVPLKNPSAYWQGFESLPLRRLIKGTQPDIIHVLDEPTSGTLFQIALQRLRISRHSKVLFYGFQNLPIRLGMRGRLKWKLTWAQLAGGATANSEALEHLKHAGFPRDRLLERIFWGISLDAFKPRESHVLRRQLGLDCEYIVGYVGRLIPEKGVMVLLDSMRKLPANVHCLFIGSGPLRAELEDRSESPDYRGRIHLYDVMESENLANHMNCLDVLAVPSLTTPKWKEQYGRVIGEAMACGVPIVGSDSGAIPEVIGSAGLIVPEGDASALPRAVRSAIFDEAMRNRLRQRGLERAERELSVAVMSARLLSFYGRVLEA